MAIGSPKSDSNGVDSGEVRVYSWDGSAWNPKGNVMVGESAGDNFGWSVSIDANGDTVAIGAPFNSDIGNKNGHARVYEFDGNIWQQKGSDLDGAEIGDHAGSSVSLSSNGNTLAIGSKWNDANGSDSGHVRIYLWTASNNNFYWRQLGQDINGEAQGDSSGDSVAISEDGDIVAIGAAFNDSSTGIESGHVRVYELDTSTSQGSWQQIDSNIDGESAGDRFGHSVAISARSMSEGIKLRVATGAPLNTDNGVGSGHVRVFENLNGWNQIGNDIDGDVAEDRSGHSVAINRTGNIVAVGSYWNDANGDSAGRVKVYYLSQDALGNYIWEQLGQDIDGEATLDQSGWSISLSSDGYTVAIGANTNDGSALNAGHVRIYKLTVS